MKRIALIVVLVVAVLFVYRRDDQYRAETPAVATAGKFEACRRERYHCVVDGDTFVLDGVHVRMADIDAPEIGGAKCEYEHALGLRAKNRLAELLNEGPFRLQPIDREFDKYGRKLRVVIRNGHSIGDDLIREGLARSWNGGKKPWC